MKKKLGLPYMGSKRQIAGKIVNKIIADNPNVKYFYDLFGGGGAVSFYALQVPKIKKVFYNELNTGVVSLLKDIIKNGVTDKYYQWVDRETFLKHKDDDDWLGGLCKVVWSFGNNQLDYLFSRDIEEYKRLAHEIVVNKSEASLNELSRKLGIKIPNSIIEENLLLPKTFNQRRLEFIKFIRKHKRFDLQQLEQLQRLQQLERLEQLGRLQQLKITNLSYDKVPIRTPINETIIYLDPPYKKTKKYQNDVNHNKLYDWVVNNKYKVYVSSYEYDLPCVLEIEHSTTLSATTRNVVIEKLFVNRK